MEEITPGEEIKPGTAPAPAGAPVYATADEAMAWTSPDPLERDYTHSDTGQTYRIAGVCKAKDRKVIHAEIAELTPNARHLSRDAGYVPTEDDVQNACWSAACVTAPKLTALQWLRFGAEASLSEVARQCLICSRIIEDRRPDATGPTVPDGEDAAEAQLNADPS